MLCSVIHRTVPTVHVSFSLLTHQCVSGYKVLASYIVYSTVRLVSVSVRARGVGEGFEVSYFDACVEVIAVAIECHFTLIFPKLTVRML